MASLRTDWAYDELVMPEDMNLIGTVVNELVAGGGGGTGGGYVIEPQKPEVSDFATTTIPLTKTPEFIIQVMVYEPDTTFHLLQLGIDYTFNEGDSFITVSAPAPGEGKKINVQYAARRNL